MLLTQEIRDGDCFVQLHLDPARKTELFSTLPSLHILHGLPGTKPDKTVLPLQWKNADLLEAVFPVAGRETVLNTVEISGQEPVTLPPVCLPYSPEFAPDQPGRGAVALAQLAATTGGQERVEIPKIWDELPIQSRYVELAPWLLVFAAFLFLLEVLERRTGWLSRVVGRKRQIAAEEKVETPSATPAKGAALPWLVRKAKPSTPAPARTAAAPSPATKAAAPTVVVETKSSQDSAMDAMRKARERAQRRHDK
jgi:hypothetical protein